MGHLHRWLSGAACVGLAGLVLHAEPAEIACPQLSKAPVIDGLASPDEWRGAAALKLTTCFGPKQGAPERQTDIRIAWDRENLYLLFRCEDPDVWSTVTEHDGPLWEGEVVELYVDPEGDGKNYREIEVNPYNVVVDLVIEDVTDRGLERLEEYIRWDAKGLCTAVAVEGTVSDRTDRDTGWTVEMAVPLQTLAGDAPLPRTGDSWRLQLYRIERPADGDPEFSAWSPTTTFHLPECFGRITFADGK